jgi:basic membrane protein A
MKYNRLVAVAAAAALVVAACGDDDGGGSSSTTASTAAGTTVAAPTTGASTTAASTSPASTAATTAGTTAPPTTAAATTAAPTTAAATTAAPTTAGGPVDASKLDVNGDGKVQVGLAINGPKDDGAYYQALVDGLTTFTSDNGLPDPIVVDNVKAEQAAQAMSGVVEQDVDLMVVGASAIAGPLAELTETYKDVFWYCNCGAGFQQLPGLAQSLDDASEINYAAGYATGLLMQARAGDKVAMIGCCDLPFEKESKLAYEAGLKAVDPALTLSYYPSGAFQFDFDNTANATEAYNTAKADGADAVYPFLGGAHEPLVKLANQDDLITMSAGRSNACERTDITYQIAVKFDGGDYILASMPRILDGSFTEGTSYTFHVGVDPEPGAVICGATAEQQDAMDTVYADIAAGKFAAQFGEIKGQAYSG